MARRLGARALLVVVSWSLAAAAQGVTIEVDATAPGAPLEPVWSYFGYDEPNYTTSAEARQLLQTLAQTQAAPVYTRTHFLFNTGDGSPSLKWGSTNVYTEDAAGRPVYDYARLDAIMDATVAAGARPLFELGFMPQALSTRPEPYQNSSPKALDGGCFYPPHDYEKWADLVRNWAEHARARYPGAESWRWELWNEPDVPYWNGTFEEYARLYDYTEAALHEVLPNAVLGGPAVAGARSQFFRQFLEHCATGTNAVTGEVGTRLDFVSFHAKGGVALADGHVRMNLGNQLRLHRSGFEAVAAWPQHARTPIVITEADPDGCAACPVSEVPANAYRFSPAYGAYVVTMMKRSLELADAQGVRLQGVLSWAFTFPEAPLFSGYRELSSQGIHLPVLNAFKLLGRLEGARVPATSSGARPLMDIVESGVKEAPEVDALATRQDDRVRVLVWSYHDELVDAAPSPVTLNVRVPESLGQRARVTFTRVDGAHGNAYAAWESQGKPATPSAAQRAALRDAMEPVSEPGWGAAVKAGAVALSFELPRFGLWLIELEPAPTPAAASGCSCRTPGEPRPHAAWVALGLAIFARSRRFFRASARSACG